jgi:hypothetical protein
MLKLGRQHKDRIWAVEGCNGIGRHIAQRLVADGETAVDMPAKLSARARVFDTGQGRKTDPVPASTPEICGSGWPSGGRWPTWPPSTTKPSPDSLPARPS